MYTILVVDDEKDIVSALEIYLKAEGYRVLSACNGKEALAAAAREDVHLILMDIMMPVMDGLSAMAQLRQTSNVPVILLTAKGEDTDKVLGLNVGADDYITKPFNPVELLARVRAALRTNRFGVLGGMPGGVFRAQGLEINYERRKVFVDGAEIKLTQTEYNIVAFLSEHAGRVMTYAAIVRAIWGDTDCGSTKKLQVNMANIRKKLGSRPGSNTYILNELGVGYRMIEEDAKPLEPAEETK